MKLSRVLLVTNESKPDAVRAAADIAAWCAGRRIECERIAEPARRAPGAVACALGGDGTVLRAAGLVAEARIPVLGVNVGSLGFLSQTSLDRLFPTLERIAAGEYEIEERMRLAFHGDGLQGTALNDLVFAGAAPRLVEIRLARREGEAVAFSGDGLVLATPTGTTAYSLSLGGPIVVPTAESIVATPHAAHILGLRSLVFSRDDELRISGSAELRLIADGDDLGRIEAQTDVIVRRAETPTLLIRLSGAPDFFETLATKLNWPDGTRRGRVS